MCYDCNETIESDKPWLYLEAPSKYDIHDWSHTLIMAPSEAIHDNTLNQVALALYHPISLTEQHLTRRITALSADILHVMDTQSAELSRALTRVETKLDGQAAELTRTLGRMETKLDGQASEGFPTTLVNYFMPIRNSMILVILVLLVLIILVISVVVVVVHRLYR